MSANTGSACIRVKLIPQDLFPACIGFVPGDEQNCFFFPGQWLHISRQSAISGPRHIQWRWPQVIRCKKIHQAAHVRLIAKPMSWDGSARSSYPSGVGKRVVSKRVVLADVPPEQKPERGHIRQNHPFTKPPFYLSVNPLRERRWLN